MKKTDYQISKVESKEEIPFNLLLLADETIEAIEKYIYHSDVYVITTGGKKQPIAVFALFKVNDEEIEIKNIAVSEVLQGKGIGSYLINEIKKIAKRQNFKSIIVGTPDSSVREINFYEKNGFAKYDVRKNFFTDNYSSPIIENGIMLRDMIMLRVSV